LRSETSSYNGSYLPSPGVRSGMGYNGSAALNKNMKIGLGIKQNIGNSSARGQGIGSGIGQGGYNQQYVSQYDARYQ
jgi:hypothetical protein